ncbi:hypothetical protein GCM10011325_08070 [Dyadobacter sediminis]|nr:hypothetical protein GCM10011325_08070 [Dyadobacter sediminis]
MGFLSFLFGCSGSSSYKKENGQWYYKDLLLETGPNGSLKEINAFFAVDSRHAFYRNAVIAGSDAESFTALSEHYARDKAHVYYCDTYRKGQEYYAVRHNRISVISDADALTFAYLESNYAKDSRKVFYEGKSFPVRDAGSFRLLEYGFARDAFRGYYLQTEIAESDGKSFQNLDHEYAKDARNIYFSKVQTHDVAKPLPVTIPVKLAETASFSVLEKGYARDNKSVFFEGNPIKGANPASFRMLVTETENADAKDQAAFYKNGRRLVFN